MSELDKYNQLKRELEVIGQSHDFLMTGKFPGGAAQTLVICQMYMQGLYKHMKSEVDKLAPLPLPEEKAKETPLAAATSDSVKAS